ncbi:MAG: hypothetical protein U0798_06620 [Gemmataceae bacterium]
MNETMHPQRAEPPLALPMSAFLDDAPSSFVPPQITQKRFSVISWVGGIVEWCFGLACLLVMLAVLASIPILQFFSLGYLLESGGRIARTGKLREGLIGIRTAARFGGMIVCCWLFLLPVRFVADLARSAALIEPDSPVAKNWRFGLLALTALTVFHLVTALANGGRIRHFLSPFNLYFIVRKMIAGGFYQRTRDAVWDAVMDLRLAYYFRLGLLGFVAAMAWILIPVTLIALGRSTIPLAPLFGIAGAFLLAFVVMYLPFMQLRFAQLNQFLAAFNLLEIRRVYARAPWMFAFAFIMTLLFALPLYLLKIEVVPQEAAWLPSLVFILFIYPSRLLAGWALARATRRETPRHWFFRWTGRLPFLPVAAFYVLVIFFTQFTSWSGIWSLYEQHAFSLPVPFVGL